MHLSQVYENEYQTFSNHLPHLVKAVSEEPGSTINSVVKANGLEGAQALFDALMDTGNRQVLVNALKSPSITGKVREQLEVFLYGESQRSGPMPLLFRKTLH